MNKFNFDLINEYCESKQIPIDDKKREGLSVFYEMLVEKNKVMNLTGITEWDDVVLRHFIDSLSLVEILDLSNFQGKVLDLGTGAGFPGMPLKILYPEVEFVLFDSLNKRIKFLDEVSTALSLDKISLVHGRAEEFARIPEHRENYDLVLSRAVANISTLSEYCLPFVKVGGSFVSYKTEAIDEELAESGKAISLLGGKVENIVRFELPHSDMKRSLLVIKKEKACSKKYPRKAGVPSKEPLK